VAENLKSIPITNLDATPVVVATTGEGTYGTGKTASDFVNPSASNTQWSTYRLCRFPTNAKVKHVWLWQSGIDTTTAAATMDFNVAFSDSTVDGTPVALQATIPSSKFDGTSLAFVSGTGYSTAYNSTGTGNKLFGSGIAVLTSGAAQTVDLTFKNTFTPTMRDDDMWDALGFTTTQGLAADPGGAFDILMVLAVAATTAKAGQVAIELDFVL
jgi:hypothetical protein